MVAAKTAAKTRAEVRIAGGKLPPIPDRRMSCAGIPRP